MSGTKIFLSWLLTVIVGSFLLPFGVMIWNGGGARGSGEFVGLVMFIGMILSALASLPTLIALLIVNATNSHKPLKVQFTYVNITHIIMFGLTLLTGNLWLYMESVGSFTYSEFSAQVAREEMLALSAVIILYALVAVPMWSIFFRNKWKEANRAIQETPNETTEEQA